MPARSDQLPTDPDTLRALLLAERERHADELAAARGEVERLVAIIKVKDVLRIGAVGFDAIKHLVLCQVEKRPPKLDLDVYPYLPRANVAKTSAVSYMCL